MSNNKNDNASGVASPGAVMGQNDDDLNLKRFRKPQNFVALAPTRKLLSNVPVMKPNRQVFIRVRPEMEFRGQFLMLDSKADNETYLVSNDLPAELVGDATWKNLYTCVDRQGQIFLWPVKIPGESGRLDEWNTSAHEAAEFATKHWVRIGANHAAGQYEVTQACGVVAEPTWPDYSFERLVQIAFKGNVIESEDHKAIRALNGEW